MATPFPLTLGSLAEGKHLSQLPKAGVDASGDKVCPQPGAYLQRFIDLENLAEPVANEREKAVNCMHRWLAGTRPVLEMIVADFCRYLDVPYTLQSHIEGVPARLGWTSVRLRCIATFSGPLPFAPSNNSGLGMLLSLFNGRKSSPDTYAVDLELSARWKVHEGDAHPVRMACCVLGPDPAEFLDENGVYRQMPLLSHLRKLVEEECIAHIRDNPEPGFKLQR